MTSDRVLKPMTDHRPPRTAPSPGAAESCRPPRTTLAPWPKPMPCANCGEDCEVCDRCGEVHHVADMRFVPQSRSRAGLRCSRCLGHDPASELARLRARVSAACDEIAHRASLADADEDPAAAALWAALGLVRTALGDDR